jgi:phage tail tube protein FII
MKKANLFLLAVLGGSLFFSCDREEISTKDGTADTDTEARQAAADATNIRIENATSYIFKDVEVNTSGGKNTYGTIAPGQKSAYKSFDFAYSYAYIKLLIDGKEFILQPIDYVGAVPIGKGKFTYVLKVADFEKRMLNIELKKE